MDKLNPLIHSQLRLAAMTLLMNLEEAKFTYLQKELETTAGNLSLQLQKLEEAGYIKTKKEIAGKRPLTTVHITEVGKQAFVQYLTDLKALLNHGK